MTTKNCAECPLVCGLRTKAAEVMADLPIAEVSVIVVDEQYAEAQQSVEHHDLLEAEERVLTEELGLSGTTDYSPEEHTAAFDRFSTVAGEWRRERDQTFDLRQGGTHWAEQTLKLADDMTANCDGGVKHGIRVPFIGVVVPAPESISSDHCSSALREYGEFQRSLGELGITQRPGQS